MNNIALIRSKKEITQEKMSSDIGVTKQVLYHWEKKRIGKKNVYKAAEYLGVNAVELLGEDLFVIPLKTPEERAAAIKIIESME